MQKLFRIIMGIMLMVLAGTSVAQAASYTVVRGDTLSAIARSNATSIKGLLALNKKITNPDRIYVGQVIIVSADEPTPTPMVESVVRKVRPATSARPTQVRSVAPVSAATLPPMPSCDASTAITRTGFPTPVVDILRDAIRDERYNEFIVTTLDTRYAFSYTETCVFRSAVREITPGSMPEGIAMRRRAEEITSPLTPLPILWEEANREPTQKPDDFLWKNPGANKCVGCDLGKFLLEKYPADVARALNQKVRDEDFAMIGIKKGDRLDDTLFGKHKTRANTVAAWTNGEIEEARAYAVVKNGRTYFLIWPLVCGNWSRRVTDSTGAVVISDDLSEDKSADCMTCPELRPSYVFPALPPGTPVTDEGMMRFYRVTHTSRAATATHDVPTNTYSAFGSEINP